MAREFTLVGGRGYTGEALLELLERHPEFAVTRAGSRSLAGRALREVFPQLGSELRFEALGPGDLRGTDGVILALPNGESAPWVAALPPQVALLDLSADHRFDEDWHYGLPELNPRRPGSPRRIANPGCYATAVQLALAPLAADLAEWPSAFGVSGFSGAGRTPSPRNDPERLADNLLPYALAGHVHEREVSHRLGTELRFHPHVASFFRGISVTVSCTLAAPTDQAALIERFTDAYGGCPLVELTQDLPEIRQVAGTPRARIGGFTVDERDPRRCVLVCVLDNLLKGAASQAVQNLNVLFGLAETTGLEGIDG